MNRRRPAALSLVALTVTLIGAPVDAQVYRWTDEHGTAHYADAPDRVPERYRPHAVRLPFRTVSPPPVPKAGESTLASGAAIRFAPGQRIVVDARIDGAPARLLVDTGADRTVVSPRTLVAAGVSLTRETIPGKIVGVTGATDAFGVTVGSLEIGRARVGPLLVVAHDLNQPGIDGLLGRDVLEQFHVSIDPAHGLLTLTPR